jgi:hypothetical protein
VFSKYRLTTRELTVLTLAQAGQRSEEIVQARK